MWQEKAWADEIVSTQYLENFNEQVMHLRSKPKRGYVEKKILVQVDNLDSQNTPNIRDFCWNDDIFILNTPENCTDLRALVDHHLGKLIKQGMRDRFWADFESSEERCNFWCSEAKEYHWRIMYKTSFKKLPAGWTREKVAKAYHKAGQRGAKGKFLNMWANKYDFKLSQQKAREWETKFVLNQQGTK